MTRHAAVRLLALLWLAVCATAACGPVAPLPTPAALAGLPTSAAPETSGGVLAQPTGALPATPTLAALSTAPPEAQASAEPAPTSATGLPKPTASSPAPPTPVPAPSPTGLGSSPTAACAEPGRVEEGSVLSAAKGESHNYRIYLPPCYGQDGRVYPTLIMLAGNVHDESFWDGMGLDEAAEALITAGLIPPVLIVMPDGGWFANETSGGPASFEGLIVDDLLPYVEQTYCAWPAREGRAIGGISRGGYWALEIAFRNAGLFGSVGAHSPALIDSFAGPGIDPVDTAVTNDLSGLRIHIDIGDRDPYLVDARPLEEALTAAGVAHEWQVNEGTHVEEYWKARLEEYLTWYGDGWRVDRAQLPACAVAPVPN